MRIVTIFLMVLTISLAVSGCLSRKTALIGGADDIIFIPKGGQIANVPLPTDENKNYTVVTPKSGYWISMNGFNRIVKATSGSAPEKKDNE